MQIQEKEKISQAINIQSKNTGIDFGGIVILL